MRNQMINLKDWSWVTRDKVVTYPQVLHGYSCSTTDSKRIVISYAMWIVLLQDCSRRLDECLAFAGAPERGFERTFSGERCYSLYNAIRHDDAGLVIDQFKAALLVLRHIPTKDGKPGGRVSHRSAKHILEGLETEFAFGRKGPVWEVIHPILLAVLETGLVEVFEVCNDLVQFLVRLTLTDCDWIDEQNLKEYVDREVSLRDNYYDPHLMSELRDQINEWFADFDWSAAKGSHGYGATYGVKRSVGTAAKYMDMYPTVETARFASLIDWTPIDDCWPGLGHAYAVLNYQTVDDIGITARPLHAIDLISKVQFVPKAFDKKRVVSMEPTTHMFFQKSIFLALDAHFKKHPEIRVDLHEQGWNRDMALRGSFDGSYATIDLSAASDTVTRTLVENLFRDTPLYYPLMYTRTSRTELPNGEIIELEKFAPMGSACCFPIECLVFSAVCAVTCKRLGIAPDYRVYGDDIVVPRAAYEATLIMLELCNFEPNMTKSYGNGSLFTESCGIECWKGADVSPLRLSRKFDPFAILKTHIRTKNGALVKPRSIGACTQLDGLYKMGNACWQKGYKSLRRLAITLARGSFLCPVFSHNFENGFFSPDELINQSLKRKTISPYENGMCGREYVRTVVNSSMVQDGPDELRYSKALEDLLNPDRVPCERACVGAAIRDFKFGWIPAELLELWYWDESYSLITRSYAEQKTFASFTDSSELKERREVMKEHFTRDHDTVFTYTGRYAKYISKMRTTYRTMCRNGEENMRYEKYYLVHLSRLHSAWYDLERLFDLEDQLMDFVTTSLLNRHHSTLYNGAEVSDWVIANYAELSSAHANNRRITRCPERIPGDTRWLIEVDSRGHVGMRWMRKEDMETIYHDRDNCILLTLSPINHCHKTTLS